MRGGSRSSRTRGGMRWTRQRRACDGIAGRIALRERYPARKTNGACAYGEGVWSWHPLLVSSRRRCCESNRVRQNLNPPATVAKGTRHRGERVISRKAIACGNAG
jgi:hypothetical protein